VIYDLVIRNGSLIDGTGSPARKADVAISNGRIAALGNLDGEGRTEIDASGLVVSPGFIDVHTHYDAQVFWDPKLTPSCFHGVTSAIGGNCGFSIAPLSPEAAPYLTRMLAKVEGMPHRALVEGVPWNWRSFGEFLDRLEGRVGINIGFLAGHSAIRRVVMGERALTDEASNQDLDAMKSILADSLAEGALGFSSTRAQTHSDAEGKPVPSRHASLQEFVELSAVCRNYEGTWLEFIPVAGAFTPQDVELMADMSAAAGRTLNWNVLVAGSDTDRIAGQLAAYDVSRSKGGEVIALTMAQPMTLRINLLGGMIFDALGGWAQVFAMPPEERMAWLAVPTNRDEIDRRGRSDESGFLKHIAEWENLIVSWSHDSGLIDRTIGEIAGERGVRPIDAMLDIALADRLATVFLVPASGTDEATWEVRRNLWRDSRTVIGASDAGAHLDMIDQFAFSTTLLGEGVRERKLIGLEEAVHQITQVAAELVGLRERGVIREGWKADITVFDPATVGMAPVETRNDLPGGEMRLYADAIGVHHVIVNGTVIVRDGEHTGSLPGTVLRSGRDTATRPIPDLLAAE